MNQFPAGHPLNKRIPYLRYALEAVLAGLAVALCVFAFCVAVTHAAPAQPDCPPAEPLIHSLAAVTSPEYVESLSDQFAGPASAPNPYLGCVLAAALFNAQNGQTWQGFDRGWQAP